MMCSTKVLGRVEPWRLPEGALVAGDPCVKYQPHHSEVKLPTQREGLLKTLIRPIASASLRAAIHPHAKQGAFWQF